MALLTLALAMPIHRLEFDASAEGGMVAHDPSRVFYEQVKQRFGTDALTIVVVKADDVFQPGVLGVVRRLSDALARLPGVSRVDSLATVRNATNRGDLLSTDALLPPAIPADAAGLAGLRADTLRNPAFTGSLVASDGRAAAINVYTDASPHDTAFNQRFSTQVDAVIAREAAPALAIFQIGPPLIKATYAQYSQEDLLRLLPLSGLLLFGILYAVCGTLQAVLVPMLTGLVSIAWTLGIMALVEIPINLLTAIVPALLIAIGFTEDIHMLSEHRRLVDTGLDRRTAVRTMTREALLPVTVTSVTTVLGFGSLITSDVTMLTQFGWASAIGLTANFVVTIVLVPVLLRILPVPRAVARRGPAALPALMQRTGAFTLRHRRVILLVAAALTVLSIVAWSRLQIDTDFISYFPEGSFIRQRAQDVHASLAGAVSFLVVVETHRPGGVTDPAIVNRIAGLQDFLAATGVVDKTLSIADFLRHLHRVIHRDDPAAGDLPTTGEQTAQYFLLLEGRDVEKYVDFDASTAIIAVRHNLSGSWEVSQLLKRLDAEVARTFPRDVTVRATGESILINNAADYLAINELTGFAFTFVVIGLIHAWLFRSVVAGFLSLVPNAVPVLMNFGLMGLWGIPLNTATAMVATIALGIAVDDTVHHMVTYSRHLHEHGDPRRAVVETLASQGPPIIWVSLALAGGFLVFVFSNFVPVVYFGVLSAVVMLIAMVGELLLTPVLMSTVRFTPREDRPRTLGVRTLLRAWRS
jgi:hydrophobe/amphiphile efflux-3 (HAE3) family protein